MNSHVRQTNRDAITIPLQTAASLYDGREILQKSGRNMGDIRRFCLIFTAAQPPDADDTGIPQPPISPRVRNPKIRLHARHHEQHPAQEPRGTNVTITTCRRYQHNQPPPDHPRHRNLEMRHHLQPPDTQPMQERADISVAGATCQRYRHKSPSPDNSPRSNPKMHRYPRLAAHPLKRHTPRAWYVGWRARPRRSADQRHRRARRAYTGSCTARWCGLGRASESNTAHPSPP